MKKIICLILSFVFCFGMFAGCSLMETNAQKDNARTAAVIESITQTFVVEIDETNEYGQPVDEFGDVVLGNRDLAKRTRAAYTYTSPKKTISKAQVLNNMNTNEGSQRLQNNYSANGNNIKEAVKTTVDEIVLAMLDGELELIEADKLFYAGALYWTKADVLEIERAVFNTIDQAIIQQKNVILAERGENQITEGNGEPNEGGAIYPVPPAAPDPESPKYYSEQHRKQQYKSVTPVFNSEKKADYYAPSEEDNFDWFDRWYTQDEWEAKRGLELFVGNEEARSLTTQAFDSFLEQIFEYSENLVGITSAQEKQIKDEVKSLKEIRDTEGVEYVYGQMANTLFIKTLIGDSYLKNKKMEKLQNFKSSNASVVSESQVLARYSKMLKEQKMSFESQAFYDEAINNDDLILYTPTNRYLFVKHILLVKFDDAQKAELNNIKNETGWVEGYNEQDYIDRRAAFAESLPVYVNIDGKPDTANPKTVKQAWDEIRAGMKRYESAPKDAERAFDEFIYKYNTDEGIFTRPKGYAVLANPTAEDTDQWVPEFADGAREFRNIKNGYSVGQILSRYVVTDLGIHVMYYASDPKAGETKSVNDYVTPGQYTSVYQTIESIVSENLQAAGGYEAWKLAYLKDFRSEYTSTKSKVVKSVINDILKELGL